MEKRRQVDEKEAQDYAKTVGAEHVLCSAKTGRNVEQVFLQLTKVHYWHSTALHCTAAESSAVARPLLH